MKTATQSEEFGPMQEGWKRLLFWTILIAGTLGLIETAASLLYYLRLSDHERESVELTLDLRRSDANSVLRYIPHPYFNYVSNPDFQFKNGYRPHNSWGLRGSACCSRDKQPGQVRIVAVGGSTTYGMYFTHERNVWPMILESKLRERFGPNIDVVNAGIPNFTSYEMIGLVAMLVPEFRPDIVLFHIGLNDAFTVGYLDEGGPDNRHFRHVWAYHPVNPLLKRMMCISHTVRLLVIQWGPQEGFTPGDMAGAIQYTVAPDDEVTRYAETATGKYFRRNVQTLVALARNMGATPIIVNMPLNPQRETGQGIYYDAVAKAVARNNRITREVAEKNRSLYIDLYSKMRDPTPFLDAAHVNQAGMEIKATVIAEQITPLIADLLKSTPQR